MKMQKVVSSNIKAIGYDKSTKTLRLELGSSRGTPPSTRTFRPPAARRSDGQPTRKGKHYHKHIKGHF